MANRVATDKAGRIIWRQLFSTKRYALRVDPQEQAPADQLEPNLDIYNAWFDLKPGVSDIEFCDRLRAYMDRLTADGVMRGWRLNCCMSGSIRRFRTWPSPFIGIFRTRSGTAARNREGAPARERPSGPRPPARRLFLTFRRRTALRSTHFSESSAFRSAHRSHEAGGQRPTARCALGRVIVWNVRCGRNNPAATAT